MNRIARQFGHALRKVVIWAIVLALAFWPVAALLKSLTLAA